jgi:7-carboxy-7-deazaguanine synthase
MVVNEIYLSLQGESTRAGLPCVFIRLTGCNLRCSWCDTAYAFTEGRQQTLEEVMERVRQLAAPYEGWGQGRPRERETLTGSAAKATGAHRAPHHGGDDVHPETRRLPLVELTGGEPLLQPAALPLMRHLCDEGFTVLLETSGALDIAPVDARVRRIMDLKCPASGEHERNRWENLAHLRQTDEIKIVIATQEDYAWSKQQLLARRLDVICPVLFSWAAPLADAQRHVALKPVPPGHTAISQRELADQIIADALPVRFQVQMHKVVWPTQARGV